MVKSNISEKEKQEVVADKKIKHPRMCFRCPSTSCCVNGGWRQPCEDSKLLTKYPINKLPNN